MHLYMLCDKPRLKRTPVLLETVAHRRQAYTKNLDMLPIAYTEAGDGKARVKNPHGAK